MGADIVAHSLPDGYTFVLSNVSPFTVSPVIFSNVHYDPVKKVTRLATAWDPVPYAGGTTPLVNPTQDDFFGYFDHNAQHITQKVGNYQSGDLLYVTNENIIDCSVAGELKVVSLAGSYDGQGWNSTPQNPFRLNLVGHWSPWGKPGLATTGTCSPSTGVPTRTACSAGP